jgi:hypothetical protein
MPGMEDSARGAFRRTAELQNFGASLSYTVADERGVFTYSQSPTAGIGSMGGLQGLVVIASVVVPNLNATRMRANEEGALATLQAIRAAEETFRSGALRDSDGDGDGEFGTFDDLLGRARPGASRPLSSRPLLTLPFKRLEDGDLAHRGYRFRVYLPAEDGSPIGGQEGQARVDAIDGDLAEMIAIVIAWPEDEASGDLAYLMDASGTIWVCQCDGLYAGSKPVPPDVLSSQARNLASAPIRPGQRGRDGLYWHRTR